MRGFTAVLIALVAIPAVNLGAQENPTLEVGDLVRITAPDCGVDEQVARYLRLFRDSLTVQADSALVLPVASVTQLDISRGFDNGPTLVGVGIGAVAGIVIGIVLAPDENAEFSSGTPTEHRLPYIGDTINRGGSASMSGSVVGPIAGAFIGGFVGGLIGKAFRKHEWEEFPLDRLRVSVVPRRAGTLSVGLSVRF